MNELIFSVIPLNYIILTLSQQVYLNSYVLVPKALILYPVDYGASILKQTFNYITHGGGGGGGGVHIGQILK